MILNKEAIINWIKQNKESLKYFDINQNKILESFEINNILQILLSYKKLEQTDKWYYFIKSDQIAGPVLYDEIPRDQGFYVYPEYETIYVPLELLDLIEIN